MMYDKYGKVGTSFDVWTAIRNEHPEMVVFGSYSAPHGDHGTGQARMFTSYGFRGSDIPVIGAETTWDFDPEDPSSRNNAKSKYWLYEYKQCE